MMVSMLPGNFDEDYIRKTEVKRMKNRRVKRIKDEDLFETVEEVFDTLTLMSVYDLLSRRVIDQMLGVVSAGKESRVYWAKSGDEDLAVKIYLTSSMEFKKSIMQYLIGDPRFEGVKKETRQIIYTWAQKEFKNLEEAAKAGVRAPRPVKAYRNILIMEFIGEDGVPAPLLKEYPLTINDAKLFLSEVLRFVKLLYTKAEIVHADLSEFNIMVWRDEIYFIDFGQAVSKRHPMAQDFLIRDLKNVLHFFKEVGVEVPELKEVCEWVME